MAKEFLDWNTRFTKQQIESCRSKYFYDILGTVGSEKPSRWDMIVWESESREYIRYAVYEAADAWRWQLFRVSMKGMQTWEKLVMLKQWYIMHCYSSVPTDKRCERRINKCRIDNYIGALVRGGQLSSDGWYRILK